MKSLRVWDPFVRIFHWSLATLFAANALIVDDDSEIHHWVGYAIVVLLCLRIVWGLIGSRYARFTSFPPSVNGSIEQVSDIVSGRRVPHAGHTPLGALMIYNLIATLFVICLSGYLMTTDLLWGVEWPEELHEVSVHWAEFSVLTHIIAVIFESVRTNVNLPKSMITGTKNLP